MDKSAFTSPLSKVRFTVVGKVTNLRKSAWYMDHRHIVVAHSIHRTPAQQRILREISNPKLSAYVREYLEWYHGDPLKRSLNRAQKHSMGHRAEVNASKYCGCFHCAEIFRPAEITGWFGDNKNCMAICPYCDIEAVIGDASGYPITPDFLHAMKERWYGEV